MKLIICLSFLSCVVDIEHPPSLHKLFVIFFFHVQESCNQGKFYLKLTYLILLVVKCDYPDTKFYVSMDIVVTEEWTSKCSYRCYFAISFSALLTLILHPVIAKMQQFLIFFRTKWH